MKRERNLMGTTCSPLPEMGELTKRSRKLLDQVLHDKRVTTEQVTGFIPRGIKGVALTNTIVAITQFFIDQGVTITYTSPSKVLLKIAYLRPCVTTINTEEDLVIVEKVINKPTVIKELQALVLRLEVTPTYEDLKKASQEGSMVSVSTIFRMFGSYENLLSEAGLDPNSYKYDRESLVEELRMLYLKLNRFPSMEDITHHADEGLVTSYGTFKKVFNGMDGINRIVELYVIPELEKVVPEGKTLGRQKKNPGLFSKEKEKITAFKIATGDQKAREEFAKANLRLVYWVAKKYFNEFLDNPEFTVTIDDLFQEGYRGLLKAIDKFDPTFDYKFSTYAVWWIRQTMERSFLDTKDTIRIPVHMMEKMRKYNKFVAKYFRNNGGPPSETLIKSEIGLTQHELEEIIATTQTISVRLEGIPSVNEDSFGPIDTIANCMDVAPDESTDASFLKEKIKQIFNELGLTEKERDILSLRFGLNQKGEHTLEEIGQKYNLSRERIRQINEKIFDKIRASRLSNDLKMFFM